jgi:hypothetical protein
MVSLPARLTQRGGVRLAGIWKFAGWVWARVSRSVASICPRPNWVCKFQVKARTSRHRPSVRNSSAAAFASRACNAAAKPSSQACASAGAVAFLRSAIFIGFYFLAVWSSLAFSI